MTVYLPIKLNHHELRALRHIRKRGERGSTLTALTREYLRDARAFVNSGKRMSASLRSVEPSERVAWRACLFARHSLRKLRKLKLIHNVPRSGEYTITARGKAVR